MEYTQDDAIRILSTVRAELTEFMASKKEEDFADIKKDKGEEVAVLTAMAISGALTGETEMAESAVIIALLRGVYWEREHAVLEQFASIPDAEKL